jgi:DNA primase catalytic core
LLRLVESQGYQLQQQGKDYALCCPFHDDKTPSCIITPKSNLFNCFGCSASGSVIDWVMKTQGVSFRHAVEILRDGPSSFTQNTRAARGAGSAADAHIKKTTVPKLEAPTSEGVDDQTVLSEVVEYYHQTLKQSPEALEYLEKRGLNDVELIDYFKLGYANRTLGLRLPQKNRKSGAALREQLQAVGIYRDTGREHFNGSLVIPVINGGLIKEIYGRKLLDNLRVGTPKHTYLPGPHDGVFNLEGLHNTEEAILCESLIDALTFWRWGFKHVTSSYGVNGFTNELQQAFIDNHIKRVLIAYDRDDAGNKAAEVVAKQLNQQGIDCFRILFPKGMDANEYAGQTQPPQKALALVIRKAEWLGSGSAPAITTTTNHCAALPSLAAKNKTTEQVPPEKAITEPVDTAATPLPAMPAKDVEVKHANNELFIDLGDRTYRVRGLDKNTSSDQLKIQLLIKRGEVFHMDKLDLYSSKQRQVFINQACVELAVKDEVIKKDLGKVLLALEEQQAKAHSENAEKQTQELEPEARKAALSLLTDPDVLNRILTDFNQAGVVGEETNKLAGYLACVSRKLEKPLAVIIQSSSAAGKSSLMESILALMPEEERVHYSAMTGQSLFYMGETNLKNKILAISEEEGASNASYALKLLQSEGEVTIASTGKDETTGNLVTKEYKVQGPVMLFLTTTAIDIDEELLNRCVVLTVNESREQTKAIHAAQRSRRTLQGLHNQLEKERIIQLHRNAQRLLRPLAVINPYADQLTFLDDKTRTRRDHEKYLTLIDSIALLHQYQRETKTIEHNGATIEYVEVTLDDIAIANNIAHEILGRTLDELPPQTRKLLKEIQTYVQRECKAQSITQRDFRFSRKAVRQLTSWGNTQLKVHLKRLEDMEYVLIHRGGRGQSFEYELLYDADNDTQQHLMGLIDIDVLQKHAYDQKKSGVNTHKSGSSRPQVGGVSGQEKWLKATPVMAYRESGSVLDKNALQAV